MLIYVFPPHYQLVCANSYTSSFSLISYVAFMFDLLIENLGDISPMVGDAVTSQPQAFWPAVIVLTVVANIAFPTPAN